MRTIPLEWKFQFTTSTYSMFLELGKSVLKLTSLQGSIQSIGNK